MTQEEEPPKTTYHPLPDYVRHIMLEAESAREGFLRAWIQQHRLKPSEAVMVISRGSNGSIQTWFERKPYQK